MARYEIVCPIFGCGEFIPVTKAEFDRGYPGMNCESCGCPLWPLELGFTGNSPAEVREFANTHDLKGNLLTRRNNEAHR